MDPSVNKSLKQPITKGDTTEVSSAKVQGGGVVNTKVKGKTAGMGGGVDDKILVIISVTLIALLALGLAGGVVWIFKGDVDRAGGLIQAILSVVTSIVTGLMGIAVGRNLPREE